VFTVTLWALNTSSPQGGYAVINATNNGDPSYSRFSNYEISDNLANAYEANTATYDAPLKLTSSTLPVQFTTFNAQCSSNGTAITWNTAAEKNNAYFEVEKSTDGNDWSSLGRVSSNSSRIYQFTDKAGGQAIYRVKQVDADGAVAYTGLVRTTCSSKAFAVSLYPIPARDKLTLVVSSEKALKTTGHVVDNYGRVVMDVPLTIAKGANNFTLDVNRLSQGQYYIRGNENGFEINQRFTITR